MLHTSSPGSGGERESSDPTTSYDNALQHQCVKFLCKFREQIFQLDDNLSLTS
jgi:hypothetical protein